MKKTWFWIPAVLALIAILVLVLRLTVFLLQSDPEPTPSPSDTTTTTTTTAPSIPADAPVHLSFDGKVLEIDGDSVLMECFDKEKFDTVWVNVAQTGVSPQAGEAYTVFYEDMVMPSLPPRITAVRLVSKTTQISTGEPLYDAILSDIVAAYPWDDIEDESGPIGGHAELSYLYFNQEKADVGYALIDLDGNGQEELLIGGAECPFPYDAFTIKDGKLVQLFSSGERYSYVILQDGYIQKEWSGSAAMNGTDYYCLIDGEMQFLERVTYDAYYAEETGVIGSLEEVDNTSCYFHSTIQDEDDSFAGYRWITAEECDEIQKKYEDYKDFDVTYTELE